MTGRQKEKEKKGVPPSVTPLLFFCFFMREEPRHFSFPASQNVVIKFKSMRLALINGARQLNDEGSARR